MNLMRASPGLCWSRVRLDLMKILLSYFSASSWVRISTLKSHPQHAWCIYGPIRACCEDSCCRIEVMGPQLHKRMRYERRPRSGIAAGIDTPSHLAHRPLYRLYQIG